VDIDFGDLLDYLGSDRATHGILLYVESIKEARKFMSAARATSRNKFVIVIKSGRVEEGAKAAASHTGALAGSDDVFDATISRAGMLRVFTIKHLFDAVETLARSRAVVKGSRLIILTNGGGPGGVLAIDCLITNGGELATLSEDTIRALDNILPPTWSGGNPVDIIGDDDADRYVNALGILLKNPDYDTILVMLVPAAVIDNGEVARAVTEEIKQTRKPVLTCWMGEDGVAAARTIFEKAGIPSYETPDSAVWAFLEVVKYGHNQENLMEIPPSIPGEFSPDRKSTRTIIENVLKDNCDMLTEPEAKDILSAYDIPVVETRIASSVEEVVQAAEELDFPVVLKILSHDISHKSDVGGVLLGIESRQVLEAAAEGMLARIRKLQPDADIQGFTVHKMETRPNAYELIIGVATDPIFGPVILFGQGGTSVEVVDDKAVALPSLNMKLANDLVSRTRINKRLRGYRDVSSVDLPVLNSTLVKISQLVVDNPEVVELDINPLFADSDGVIALDARIKIAASELTGPERLVIMPYSQELEEKVVLDSGIEIIIRPIRPEDEAAHHEFLNKTDKKDIYFRFFRAAGNFTHPFLARFTQIDYDRDMAFIATSGNEKNESGTLGVIRAVSDADNNEAEIAIIVRSDEQGQGF